jgi:aminopeptidase N
VCCRRLIWCTTDANGADLSQLERWYSQAGTPHVLITQHYDAAAQRLTLRCRQHTPATPNQPFETKLPQLIPIVVGLLDRETGREIVPSTVLCFTQAEQEFHFDNLPAHPVVSALRDFSAPVKLELAQTDAELCLLMAHDTDPFNRWEAGNRYFTKLILSLAAHPVDTIRQATLPETLVQAVRTNLQAAAAFGDSGSNVDSSLAAYALQLPDLATLINEMSVVDIDQLHAARTHVQHTLATALATELKAVYYAASAHLSAPYQFVPAEVGRRRLQNTCLEYLTCQGGPAAATLAKNQFDRAGCMTDKLAALRALASQPDTEEAQAALAAFYEAARGTPLVVNKWFAIQAGADHPAVLQRVQELKQHPDFLLSNPNRARSVINTFAHNLPHFHAADGSGYAFVADCILELDPLNPTVAARMVTVFSQWKDFAGERRGLMEAQLRRILAQEKLSKDTFENVQRCLA